MKGARDLTLSCRWWYACWSGAIARQSGWCQSIRLMQCPGSVRFLNTEWMLAMERLRPVFYKWGEPQIDMFATFSNRRLIKLYRHIRTPGQSGRTWCPLPGTTGGASCTHSRHWSWSLRCYRRSNSLMECKWFLWLHCKKQLTGIRSFWNYRKKIRSHCTSKATTANPRRHSARQRDGNPSLPAVKSTPMETLQPS